MSKLRRLLVWLLGLTVVCGLVGAWAARWYYTTQPDYRLRCGQEALSRGDAEAAERQALQLETAGHADYAHLLRAEVLFCARRYAQTLQELNQIRDQGELRLKAIALSGQCLLYLREAREAERVFHFVLSECPDHIDAHRGLAALYYDRGAMWLAVQHLETVARLEPRDGRPYRWLGLIYKDLPYDNARAISCYEEALCRELSEQAAEEVKEELAECLVKQSDYVQALEVLEGCDHEAAETPKLVALRAECLWALGRGTEAQALVDRALSAQPRFPGLLRLRAQWHVQDKGLPAAASLLERALEIDRHDYLSRFQLYLVYQSLGRPAAAAEQRRLGQQTQNDLKELTDLNLQAMNKPRDASVRRRLAELCQKLDKPDLAAMWLRAAADCSPGPETSSGQAPATGASSTLP